MLRCQRFYQLSNVPTLRLCSVLLKINHVCSNFCLQNELSSSECPFCSDDRDELRCKPNLPLPSPIIEGVKQWLTIIRIVSFGMNKTMGMKLHGLVFSSPVLFYSRWLVQLLLTIYLKCGTAMFGLSI